MNRIPRILALLLLLGFVAAPLPALRAQDRTPDNSPTAQRGKDWTPGSQHMDEPETSSDVEQYRHSAMVKTIARIAHIKTETAAQIFEDLNSAVLLIAIGWALWKILPKVIRGRGEKLRKDLDEARLASEDANRRLAQVEARLLRLDSEIDVFRKQAEQESVEDEKRIRAALEEESRRIVASAEQEISATQAAAQRELKKFAANLAIDNAVRRIQLSAETDRALVRDFGKSLKKSEGEA